jgi:hypothetical protein
MSLEHAPSRQKGGERNPEKRAGFLLSIGGRRLVTIRDAGALLGGVVIRTVERMHARDPRFPRFVVIGNRRYLDHDELQAFIADSPRGGAAEEAAE